MGKICSIHRNAPASLIVGGQIQFLGIVLVFSAGQGLVDSPAGLVKHVLTQLCIGLFLRCAHRIGGRSTAGLLGRILGIFQIGPPILLRCILEHIQEINVNLAQILDLAAADTADSCRIAFGAFFDLAVNVGAAAFHGASFIILMPVLADRLDLFFCLGMQAVEHIAAFFAAAIFIQIGAVFDQRAAPGRFTLFAHALQTVGAIAIAAVFQSNQIHAAQVGIDSSTVTGRLACIVLSDLKINIVFAFFQIDRADLHSRSHTLCTTEEDILLHQFPVDIQAGITACGSSAGVLGIIHGVAVLHQNLQFHFIPTGFVYSHIHGHVITAGVERIIGMMPQAPCHGLIGAQVHAVAMVGIEEAAHTCIKLPAIILQQPCLHFIKSSQFFFRGSRAAAEYTDTLGLNTGGRFDGRQSLPPVGFGSGLHHSLVIKADSCQFFMDAVHIAAADIADQNFLALGASHSFFIVELAASVALVIFLVGLAVAGFDHMGQIGAVADDLSQSQIVDIQHISCSGGLDHEGVGALFQGHIGSHIDGLSALVGRAEGDRLFQHFAIDIQIGCAIAAHTGLRLHLTCEIGIQIHAVLAGLFHLNIEGQTGTYGVGRSGIGITAQRQTPVYIGIGVEPDLFAIISVGQNSGIVIDGPVLLFQSCQHGVGSAIVGSLVYHVLGILTAGCLGVVIAAGRQQIPPMTSIIGSRGRRFHSKLLEIIDHSCSFCFRSLNLCARKYTAGDDAEHHNEDQSHRKKSFKCFLHKNSSFLCL